MGKKKNEAKELYSTAIDYCRQEWYSAALEILDETTKKYPRFVDGWLKKASIYGTDLGNYENALEVYEQALTLRPNYPKIMKAQAAFFTRFKKYEKALEVYNSLLEIEPNNIELLGNTGKTLIELNQLEKANITFDKILAHDPSSSTALCSKGDICFKQDLFEKALNFYNQSLKSNQDSYYVWEQKGIVLEKMNQEDEAKIAYDNACKNMCLFSEKFFTLERDHYKFVKSDNILNYMYNPKKPDYKISLRLYNNALSLNPNHVQALYGKGEILLELKDYNNALNYFEKTLEFEPDCVSALKKKGDALLKLNRKNEALKVYSKAHGIDPNDPRTKHVIQELECHKLSVINKENDDNSWYLEMKYGKFK
jgi:tetratricopeptide (TPR) repeat protein